MNLAVIGHNAPALPGEAYSRDQWIAMFKRINRWHDFIDREHGGITHYHAVPNAGWGLMGAAVAHYKKLPFDLYIPLSYESPLLGLNDDYRRIYAEYINVAKANERMHIIRVTKYNMVDNVVAAYRTVLDNADILLMMRNPEVERYRSNPLNIAADYAVQKNRYIYHAWE